MSTCCLFLYFFYIYSWLLSLSVSFASFINPDGFVDNDQSSALLHSMHMAVVYLQSCIHSRYCDLRHKLAMIVFNVLQWLTKRGINLHAVPSRD